MSNEDLLFSFGFSLSFFNACYASIYYPVEFCESNDTLDSNKKTVLHLIRFKLLVLFL